MKSRRLAAIIACLTSWAFSSADNAAAQRFFDGLNMPIIDVGIDLTVRVNETIRSDESDGRVFSGFVAQDVRDRRKNLVVPRGSSVELIVRRTPDDELTLDLDSVVIFGERYAFQMQESVVAPEANASLKANNRTGECFGGGGPVGTLMGAVSGVGSRVPVAPGACIAARSGPQAFPQGSSIDVPSDSLVMFRLAKPLRGGIDDNGYLRGSIHYHQGYGSNRVETQQAFRQKPGSYSNGQANISIRTDNNVVWQAPQSAFVYVQVDNDEPRFFSSGLSGVQPAPWITRGHRYTFTLQDDRGNVIARVQLDLTR